MLQFDAQDKYLKEMLDEMFPPLTLELLIEGRVNRDMYSSSEIRDILDTEGYKFYGWLNDGIKFPLLQYETAYSSYSGAITIMVNHDFGCYYCVDMS
jgi:hypothetical protein